MIRMDEVTMCNVKRCHNVRNDEPTDNYFPDSALPLSSTDTFIFLHLSAHCLGFLPHSFAVTVHSHQSQSNIISLRGWYDIVRNDCYDILQNFGGLAVFTVTFIQEKMTVRRVAVTVRSRSFAVEFSRQR